VSVVYIVFCRLLDEARSQPSSRCGDSYLPLWLIERPDTGYPLGSNPEAGETDWQHHRRCQLTSRKDLEQRRSNQQLGADRAASTDRCERVVLADEIRGEHRGEQLSGKTGTTGATDAHG
jgi:hypothetical protein